MTRSILPCILLLLAVACSPVVRSTSLGMTYPPRPPDSEFLIFSVRTPECGFEEVGLITVEKENSLNFIAVDDPLAALQKRARRMGGDAVIGLTQLPPAEGFYGGLRGTVIRFAQEGCRR